VVHERRWRLEAGGNILRGEDLFVADGQAAGAGDVAIRFHLHPAVRVSEVAGGVRLILPNDETWMFEASSPGVRLEESVFFPTTDRPRRTEQIVLAFNRRDTQAVTWRFRRVETPPTFGETVQA
jgi:uncharacterized heparinase superfamily protein